MTTPLCTGRRHTIFILIRALHKAIRNSPEEPAPGSIGGGNPEVFG